MTRPCGRVARRGSAEAGYAMAALLVGISVMGVVLSVVMPSWSTLARRERESELVFRGQQYARAVTLFQRKMAGAYPPNLDILLTQKFLRKKYKDPITNDDFVLIPVGDPRALQGGASATPGGTAGSAPAQGRGGPPLAGQQPTARGGGGGGAPGAGIQGVVSKSTGTSLRVYNGRSKYNEWVFIGAAASTAAGAAPGAGTQNPGVPGRGGAGFEGLQGPQFPGGRGAPSEGRPQQPGRGAQPPGRGGQPPAGMPPGFPFPGGAGRGRF